MKAKSRIVSLLTAALSAVLALVMGVAALNIQPKTVSAEETYVETDFGAGKLLITTTDKNGIKYYLPTDEATSGGPAKVTFDVVSDISDAHLWTVTAADKAGEYYIQNSDEKYLSTTSDNNGVRVNTTKGTWKYDSLANSLQYTGTSRYLGVYVSGSNWRSYTSTAQANYSETSTKFTFYTINATEPSVSIEGNSFTDVNTAITLEAKLANIEGTVAWSSSNTDVATVVDGVVMPVAMGTTTITADVNGTQGTKEIKVYPVAGEVSIADALAICELTGNANSPYSYSTVGTIESIVTAYDSTNNRITVTITDATGSIQAYRMAGGSDLAVGSKITVKGTLVNYNGTTPEFITGCTYEPVLDDTQKAIQDKLDTVNAYMQLAYKYTATTTTENVEAKDVVFALGADGETGHSDNSSAKTSYTETVEGYTLNLTDAEKMYPDAKDEMGKSCIKLGTKDTVAKFTFTVPNEITKVIIAVAGYKDATVTVKVNDDSYAITTISNKGEYTDIEVNTTSNKTVKFETTATGYRAMVNSITYKIEGGTKDVTTYSNSEFKFMCAVDDSLKEIADLGVAEWGIRVTAGGKSKNYTTAANSWTEEDGKVYVVISLGDILGDIINYMYKLTTDFTVEAYAVCDDGTVLTSAKGKNYSVADIVEKYSGEGKNVGHLHAYLKKIGAIECGCGEEA